MNDKEIEKVTNAFCESACFSEKDCSIKDICSKRKLFISKLQNFKTINDFLPNNKFIIRDLANHHYTGLHFICEKLNTTVDDSFCHEICGYKCFNSLQYDDS